MYDAWEDSSSIYRDLDRRMNDALKEMAVARQWGKKGSDWSEVPSGWIQIQESKRIPSRLPSGKVFRNRMNLEARVKVIWKP